MSDVLKEYGRMGIQTRLPQQKKNIFIVKL